MALANLYIEYTTNSGVTWYPIASGYGIEVGDDSYDWVIPDDVDSNNAMIRLTDLYTNEILATSSIFSIKNYDSISKLLINKTKSTKLVTLEYFVYATTWCSRAVLETFETIDNKESIDFIESEGIETLIIDEYDRATTPSDALPNTTYYFYSKIIYFIPDEMSETTSINVTSNLWAMQISEEHFSGARVKLEFNTNPNNNGDWFVCYDTGTSGSTIDILYPNRYLDYSRTIIQAHDTDPFGNEVVPTVTVRIRVSITTNSQGLGGYINYYAFLADPSPY